MSCSFTIFQVISDELVIVGDGERIVEAHDKAGGISTRHGIYSRSSPSTRIF